MDNDQTETLKGHGHIVVSPEGISVRWQGDHESSEVGYHDVTVENLQDAARILAAWMSLKYEDIGKECRRIHAKDQTMAFLKSLVEQFAQENQIKIDRSNPVGESHDD